MTKDQAIARIKKCLALSKSPNEHEAAAALRQAQKLMAMHDIDMDEVDGTLVTSDFVDVDDYEYAERKPLIVLSVVKVCKQAFGVECVWERSPNHKHRIRYFGLQANVMLATHSHVVVYRAVNSAWRAHLKASPWLKGRRNARASFAMGWCTAVADKVADLNPDPEMKERIARKKLEHYGPRGLGQAQSGSATYYPGIEGAGAAKGAEFNINRPVNTDRRYLEDKR